MITVTRRGEDGALVTGGEELIPLPGPRWIDIQGPSEAELASLGATLKLHRLAIEDSLHLDQRPKLEEYPNHLFVVLHAFTSAPTDVCELTLQEMHFFLGKDFLVTVHENTVSAIATARARMNTDPEGTFGRGLDFALYLVADALVDENFPVLDSFGDELEDLESEIFTDPDPGHVQRMFRMKRALVHLRRVLSPQRDVVGQLARGVPHVGERTTLYFRDIFDHLIRLYEQLEATRDLLSSVMDGYLSTVANKTGQITKQLTIFSTIFLPLSFIVGFFGQNFERLSQPVFFWIMIATMLLVPGALVLWFRHLRWI